MFHHVAFRPHGAHNTIDANDGVLIESRTKKDRYQVLSGNTLVSIESKRFSFLTKLIGILAKVELTMI